MPAYWIARSKIVLNLHQYDAQVFEIVRVSYLLANRRAVVSERGANPTEDRDLSMNQIDFLIRRYPGHVIGFSTHEYRDWTYSMVVAWAKSSGET